MSSQQLIVAFALQPLFPSLFHCLISLFHAY